MTKTAVPTSRQPTPASDPGRAQEGRRERNVSAYYDRSILKAPVWTGEVPAYFFLGGLAGASAGLALAARLTGWKRLHRTALLGGFGAFLPCAPLLIADLGRPERFLNMMRVFRPTSPMNVGTWILSAFGAGMGTAVASEVTGLLPSVGAAGEAAAATLGPGLATYTGVLVGNTSVPVWHEARRHLPVVFMSGAAASAGALACALTRPRDAGPARVLATVAAVGEVSSMIAMERHLGSLAEPYRTGSARWYSRAALGFMLGGAGVLTAFGRTRPGAIAGALLTLAGAASTRFAAWQAGKESAKKT
jgi:formate-dependent nitrite reductase membrane component NrfD